MPKDLNFYFKNKAIVDIIAPSSLCEVKKIKESIKYIKNLGFTPRFNKQLLLKPKGALASQTLLQKEKELEVALAAPDSSIIWCLRGGAGSFKLLPFLLKLKKSKNPKLLIGYSDITALHYAFNHKWGWPSLHFSGIEELSGFFSKYKKHQPGYLKLLGIIKNKTLEYKNLNLLNPNIFESTKLKKSEFKKEKNTFSLKSVIVGGNLCTLVSLLGSKSLSAAKISIPSKSSILFLEDINEPAYKVDRMLYQLKEAGYFKNIRAVLLGDFMANSLESKKIKVILTEFFSAALIPVIYGLKSGHAKVNNPLPFMIPVQLSFNFINKKPKISIRLYNFEK